MLTPLSGRLESGFLLGVLPSLFTVGPLALLAWLFPATFGALALLVRKRFILFTVFGAISTLYLAQATFRTSLAGNWWGSQSAFWWMASASAAVGLIGTFRREKRSVNPAGEIPGSGAAILLGISSFVCLGIAAESLLRSDSRLWLNMLPICVSVWIGFASSIWLSLKRTSRASSDPASFIELAMLAGLFLACVVAAMLMPPGRANTTMKVIWAFEPSERGAIVSTPLVSGQHIYIGAIRDGADRSRGAVYAIDRRTGKTEWQFDDEGRMLNMFSTPCLDGHRLYIGEGMHADFACKLYCLSIDDGHKLWEFRAQNHIESSPTVVKGKVYVGAGDDGLYCLDGATGTILWNFREALHIDASPAVFGDCVYASSGVSRRYRTTEVFCLDGLTGQVRWRKQTDLPGWGSPQVVENRVYVGLGNGRLLTSAPPPEKPAGALLCLNATTGETVFRFATSDAVLDRPATDFGRVYITSRDGFIYSLDGKTGTEMWRFDLHGPAVTTPAIASQQLYAVPIRGPIFCLDAISGQSITSFDLEKWNGTEVRLLSSPVIATERIGDVDRDTIYLGAEVRGPLGSSAVLYAIQHAP